MVEDHKVRKLPWISTFWGILRAPADLSSGPGLSFWPPSSSEQGWPWPAMSPSSHLVPQRKRTLAVLCGSILPEDRTSAEFPTLFLPSMERLELLARLAWMIRKQVGSKTLLCAQDLLVNPSFLWSLLFIFYKMKSTIGVGFSKQVACPNSCPSHYL